MICGETIEIVVPHFDPAQDHTVRFRCQRKPGHRPPHTPNAKTAEKYDREDERAMGDYADNVWRVGRKLGRTIYAVLEGGTPAGRLLGVDDCDVFLGMMETRELAQNVVDAHNDNVSMGTKVRAGLV